MILWLLALGLAVAWQGVRAVAWHGWAAAELVAALGVLAVVAGALSDTAKAYSTEKRVNQLAGRTQTHLSVEQLNNNIAKGAALSWPYTIPAGTAQAGSEFEFFVEGDGTWGAHVLALHILLGGTELATCKIGGNLAGAGIHVSWWARGTVTVVSAGSNGVIRACLFGGINDTENALPTQGGTPFGAHVGGDGSKHMDTTADRQFYLTGEWDQAATTGNQMTSYKTRITHRGP